MTADDLRAIVLRTLAGIAPEMDPAELRPEISLRDQLDLDSMDFLNFVIALHEQLRVDIPESDYSKLASLDDAVAYLATKTKTRSAAGQND